MARTIQLDIEGMTCGHCQKAVTKALQGLADVEQVDVDLEKGEATVEVSTDADPEKLVAAVQEEGYEARVK